MVNDQIAQRLAGLGLELPQLPAPRYHYIPATHTGELWFFSGKTPIVAGALLHPGRLGDLSVDKGRQAARVAALNLLAAIETELGLENVSRVLKITGFVASADGFVEQPTVIDAASELLVDVLGDAGRHARSAIGVASLPGNAAVEVEAIVSATRRQIA
ncbi:RidA family protein [Actinacidiphila oryziradicis]|uniref:RidA family protein n=1 Tax=Actinacidiphila oryziradicis TaxID=2571141 RepID=A0A4U0RXU4_9ACTN|nr:RidA family protein [Actinacidiphila oryziradicis]